MYLKYICSLNGRLYKHFPQGIFSLGIYLFMKKEPCNILCEYYFLHGILIVLVVKLMYFSRSDLGLVLL